MIVVPGNLAAGEVSLPGFQTATFSMCSQHDLFPVSVQRDEVSLPLLVKTQVLSD